MENNITKIEIVNIEKYLNQLKELIKEIIKNSTYIEINNYIEMLPLPHHQIHS